MNNINELQNRHSAIEKLAAQRCLYSEAKNIFYLRTLLALGVAVALPYISTAYPESKYVVAIIALAYLAGDIFFLKKVETNKKNNAAKIQELFDTEVLSIKWNEFVADGEPDQEIIGSCSLKASKEGLPNWYPVNVEKLPHDIAKSLCQRSNVYWDSNLRRLYAGLLTLVFVLIGCSSLWVQRNETVANTIVFFASIAPLLQLLWEQKTSHREAAKRLDALKNYLDQILEKAMTSSGVRVDESVTRSIQDEIYRHRSNVALIPDLLYKILKKKYEHKMNFSSDKYVGDYIARYNLPDNSV